MSKRKLTKSIEVILEKSRKASESCMPVSFVGMYDCGKNYAFGNLNQDRMTKDVMLIKIDLAGAFGETEKVLEAISLSFKVVGFEKNFETFKDFKFFITDLCKKQKVLLALNFAFMEEVNTELVLSIYSLRNLLGYQFNWLAFANYGFVHSENSDIQNIYEKIFFSDVYYFKLHDTNEIKLNLQSTSLIKIGSKDIVKISELSGGNSGLIRALGLMATKGINLNLWEKDLSVSSRLRRIISELNDSEKSVLLGKKDDVEIQNRLTNAGYINKKGKIFSPMFEKLLKENTSNKLNLADLTPTQEAVWTLLSKLKGNLVSREDVAQTLWGRLWQEKYSDWTIDQAVYSLRQKLVELGVRSKISTKKGKGFILEK